jgi:DNA-binding MarR family transcriptional regulator
MTETNRSSVGAGPDTEWPGLPPGEVGLLTRIMRLNMLVTSVLDRLVEPHGVTVADYLVLATVRRSPGGRTLPSTICRVLGRTSGGMSLTLDRLAAAGRIRRGPDPADRRRVTVELTPEGLALARRVNDALHAWERSLPLAPSQHEVHHDHLDTLIAIVEAGPVSAPGPPSPS